MSLNAMLTRDDASLAALTGIVGTCLRTNPFLLPQNASQDLVREIDGAVQSCERIICALKCKRNLYARINRLPDEILGEVFWNTVDDKEGSFRCIPLGLVCRRWRELALGFPRLWSSIVVDKGTDPDIAHELVCRSQEVPLDVVLSDGGLSVERRTRASFEGLSRVRTLYDTVLHQLPRIRSLTILAAALHGPSEILMMIPKTPAPQLQSLHLRVRSPASNKYTDLFSRDFPALRNVSSGCSNVFDALSLARPTVTSFKLSTFHGLMGSRVSGSLVSTAQLISALCKMPLLQNLTLFLVFCRLTHNQSEDNVVASLPSLRRLHLRDDSESLVRAIHSLRPPPYANLRVHFSDSPITSRRRSIFQDRLTSILHARQLIMGCNMTPYLASIRGNPFHSTYEVELRIQPVGEPIPDSQPPRSTQYTLSSSARMAVTFRVDDVNIVPNILPLDRLNILEFHQLILPSIELKTFMQCLAESSLQTLIFHQCKSSSLKLLLSPDDDESNTQNATILLPGLKTLVFEDMYLGPAEEETSDMTPSKVLDTAPSEADILKDTLRIWQEARGPVDSIHLWNCSGLIQEEMAPALDLGAKQGTIVHYVDNQRYSDDNDWF